LYIQKIMSGRIFTAEKLRRQIYRPKLP